MHRAGFVRQGHASQSVVCYRPALKMVVASSIADLVGGTDLLRLRVLERGGARVWGKLESQNPSGSVADRAALAMLLSAPAGTIVEATSGDMGVALAMACRRLGRELVLTLPESASLEARYAIKVCGAKVVLTPHALGMTGAIAEAEAIASRTPGAFCLRQYDNDAGARAHASTAEEILQLLPNVHVIVAGIGTGATASGIGRALRSANASARVVGVEPAVCATISRNETGRSRIQGLGAGFVPRVYDAGVVSEVRVVSDEDAWETKLMLAKRAGVLVGTSAGAAAFVASELAKEIEPDGDVVAILPDTGERYFSAEKFFSKEP